MKTALYVARTIKDLTIAENRTTAPRIRFTFHASRFTSHVSRLTLHVSLLTLHVSRFTFHSSRSTLHATPGPGAPGTRSLSPREEGEGAL